MSNNANLFWIDSNSNRIINPNEFTATLTFYRNSDIIPEFTIALGAPKQVVLDILMQYFATWMTIKILTTVHVHYESANLDEIPQ